MMIHGWKLIGLFTMRGALLSLSALAVPAGLPSCIHQEPTAGTLQWQCTGEGLLGRLASTLTLFAEHLTAVLHNPPKDIQLLLYNWKQRSLKLPINKAYRIYKEQLMLPTMEDFMPWDWSYVGLGPIFFIDSQSPETVYFLEAPKKDPDCEVDWWLYWGYLKEISQTRWPPTVYETFAENQPITQNIEEYYYIPEVQPVWEYPRRFHDMSLTPKTEHFCFQKETWRRLMQKGITD